MTSYAAIRRQVQVGTTIEVLTHWAPWMQGEMHRFRTVAKAQKVSYAWPFPPEHEKAGKLCWSTWPKATEVTVHDDDSFTVAFGPDKSATYRIVPKPITPDPSP